MKTKRVIAFITMLIMSVTVISQCFVTAFAEDTVTSTDGSEVGAETFIDDVEVSGTNSVGDLLASEFQEKQAEQLENNGYNIFSIEMDGNIATVDFQVQGSCTLIVGIYDDSATTMLASGTAEVQKEETLTTVEIPVIAMPDYFYIKAYLVNSETLEPLCIEYTNPNYTQHMQEFFSKTTDDFDSEKVLNFDDDKTNNFAVYSDNVIIIPYEEGCNTSVTYDEETGTYTVENASENIQSLKEGDLFAYNDDVLEPVVAKVGSISVDGTTVTIIEDKTSLDEVFDYVRIDASQNLGDAEAECYNGAEIVDLNTQEETPAEASVNMPGEAPVVRDDSVQDEPGVSYTFKHKFGEEPTTESTTSDKENNDNDNDNDKDKDKDKTKPYADVDGDLSLTATLKITIGAVLNLDLDDYYMELNIDYESSLDFTAEGSVTLNVPIGYYKFEPVPGFKISLQPSVVFELSAEFTLNVTSEGRIGIKLQDGEVKNNSKWPVTKAEIKGEVSFFYGFRLNPKFTFISEKVLGATSTCEIGVKIGASIGGSVDTTTETDIDKIKEYHECKICIDGDISFIFKMDFSIKFLKTTITLTPVNISPKIGDFYYSLDTGKFAFTECPNIYHKIKILVKDPDKDVLPNVKVECEPENAFKTMSLPYITETAKDLVTDEKGCVTVYARMGKTKVICTHGSSEPKEFELTTAIGVDDVFLLNGIEQETLTCTLKPKTYVVKVTVTDNDDRIVCHPSVKYNNNNNNNNKSCITGDNKGVAYLNLYEGKYNIVTSSMGYMDKATDIEVKNNMDITVKLEPYKYGTVKFAVKDKFGNPIKDARIQVRDYLAFDKYTDENGNADFSVRTGEHSLVVYYKNTSAVYTLDIAEDETYNLDIALDCEVGTSTTTTATATSTTATATSTTTTTTTSDNIVDSGNCGADYDNLTWTLDDKGTLIISGTGDMKYYAYKCSPWNNVDIRTVIINDGVTSIGGWAFNYCENLTSITIPDSVINIENAVFYDCKSLTSITIPNGITSIGMDTFEDCKSLTSVTIPDSVTSIDSRAFGNCDSLTSITIPDSVTSISVYAFRSCDSLTSITIENPNCEIYDDSCSIPDTATIYGYPGSTAEAYAKKYDREFVALDEPETISLMQNEPIEILAEEPTETADDDYILPESEIHSLTDLLPNAVYNYYVLYDNTDTETILNPGNIQYITQFTTDENGSAEINLGYSEITDEAVRMSVPVSPNETPIISQTVTLGDVNQDGMTDASDASQILAIYAVYSTGGTPEETEQQLLSADVNKDNMIDASDASTVLAYYAYLSTGGTVDIETFMSNPEI